MTNLFTDSQLRSSCDEDFGSASREDAQLSQLAFYGSHVKMSLHAFRLSEDKISRRLSARSMECARNCAPVMLPS
jgi:hypothetical protein